VTASPIPPSPASAPPTAGPSRSLATAGREHPHGRRRGRRLAGDGLTRALGVASLGLAVPQILAPGGFARLIGVGGAPRHRAATAAVGARELAAATGLLGQASPAWLWARVSGDIMDLGLLARALKNHDRRGLARTAAAMAAVAGIAAVDTYAAASRSRRKTVLTATAATTVGRPPREVYDLWRRLESLPSFMAHLGEVRITGELTSHWRASAPFGATVEWDAEITAAVPGERIAWRSLNGMVGNEGEVWFTPAPGGRGTEVHVTLRYWVPAGRLGKAVARYFGEDPHQQLDDDLRRFKQVTETGEVVRSDGAPSGKRARREFPQHPARPLSAKELAEEALS
jgi:uncharacterized membrane protein